MGETFSHPISVLSEADSGGLLCIVLRAFNKVRLLHAPRQVVDVVHRVVREISQNETTRDVRDSFGSTQFYLPRSPFVVNSGSDSATIGKIFALRMFEEMNALGYDFVCSTDLSRLTDQSTWYFRKVDAERTRQPVLCVAPGGADKIILVRAKDYVLQAVKESVQEVWRSGIQEQTEKTSRGEGLYEFKLRGNPWLGEGQHGNDCRLLLKDIVARLGRLRWRLLAATNLKGGTDSLFFIFDENYTVYSRDLALLSLNRLDRLRLFNFDSGIENVVSHSVRDLCRGQEPETRQYYDALEFKMKGSPFHCSGSEAIATRRMFCKLLEAFNSRGWEPLTTIDISRKINDKSVFLFKRCEPADVKFACVFPSSTDKVRLLNFPPYVAKALRDVVAKFYLPGNQREQPVDEQGYEIVLNGHPWTENSSFNLQARTMLLVLLRHCESSNWRLKASADVSAKYHSSDNGPDYPIDVHSWFLGQATTGQDSKLSAGSEMPPYQVSHAGGAGAGAAAGGWQLPAGAASGASALPPPTYEEAADLWKP